MISIEGAISQVFQLAVIPGLRLTTRMGGEWAWRAWEGVSRILAKCTGFVAKFRYPNIDCSMVGHMRIIDRADKLIKAEGEWVETNSVRAVKRITFYPHAGQLQLIPDFCTRLGVLLGQETFGTYAPKVKVAHTIRRTLSQGDPYCEYILENFS